MTSAVALDVAHTSALPSAFDYKQAVRSILPQPRRKVTCSAASAMTQPARCANPGWHA